MKINVAKLYLDRNPNFIKEVIVRESDEYTNDVFLRFCSYQSSDSPQPCNEMFITPYELEILGRFFLKQAVEIRTAQEIRKK
jgi:hypothetical protein